MLAAKFNLVLANAIPPVSVGKKVYRLGVTKKVPFTMTAIYGGEVKPKLAWELTLSEGVFTFVMGDIPWEDWERMMAVWFTDTGRKTAEGDVIYSLSDMVVWTNRNLIAPYALIALILLRDAKEDGGLSNDHLSRLSAEPVTDEDVMQAVVKAAKMGLNMNLIAKRFPKHIVEAVETAKKQIEAATEVKTEETTEPEKLEETTEQPSEAKPKEAETTPETQSPITEGEPEKPAISPTVEETKNDTVEVIKDPVLVAPNASKNGKK